MMVVLSSTFDPTRYEPQYFFAVFEVLGQPLVETIGAEIWIVGFNKLHSYYYSTGYSCRHA